MWNVYGRPTASDPRLEVQITCAIFAAPRSGLADSVRFMTDSVAHLIAEAYLWQRRLGAKVIGTPTAVSSLASNMRTCGRPSRRQRRGLRHRAGAVRFEIADIMPLDRLR
jgi:hypothetical protein